MYLKNVMIAAALLAATPANATERLLPPTKADVEYVAKWGTQEEAEACPHAFITGWDGKATTKIVTLYGRLIMLQSKLGKDGEISSLELRLRDPQFRIVYQTCGERYVEDRGLTGKITRFGDGICHMTDKTSLAYRELPTEEEFRQRLQREYDNTILHAAKIFRECDARSAQYEADLARYKQARH